MAPLPDSRRRHREPHKHTHTQDSLTTCHLNWYRATYMYVRYTDCHGNSPPPTVIILMYHMESARPIWDSELWGPEGQGIGKMTQYLILVQWDVTQTNTNVYMYIGSMHWQIWNCNNNTTAIAWSMCGSTWQCHMVLETTLTVPLSPDSRQGWSSDSYHTLSGAHHTDSGTSPGP